MVLEPVLFDWQRRTKRGLWLITAIAADDTALLPHQPSVAIGLGTVEISLRLTVFVTEPFDPRRDPRRLIGITARAADHGPPVEFRRHEHVVECFLSTRTTMGEVAHQRFRRGDRLLELDQLGRARA